MTGIAQRPARGPTIEEREAAMPISEASKLLFDTFSTRDNPQLCRLKNKYIATNSINRSYDSIVGPRKTSLHSYRSPAVIEPHNVGRAEEIVTVGFRWNSGRHGRGIVVAQTKEGVRAYWHPEYSATNGSFHVLSNWNMVRNVLHFKKEEDGVEIASWHWFDFNLDYYHYSQKEPCQWQLRGLSLLELLESLREQ